MSQMLFLSLVVSGALMLEMPSAQAKTAPAPVATAAPEASKANQVEVAVQGMVCPFCAQGIEKKFKEFKQVDTVDVDLDKKLISLKFKDGQRLTDKEINETVKNAGYTPGTITAKAN